MNNKPTLQFAIDSLKNYSGELVTSGSGGVGASVEHVIGISPNNFQSPDTCTHEMKTTHSKCDITLFTKSPERGDTYDIVLKYGYQDYKNRRAYKKDIKANSFELFCRADSMGIGIYDEITGDEICYWSHTHCQSGYDKIANIIKINAKKMGYNYSVENVSTFDNFILDKFIELINIGAISISPRRYFTSTTKNYMTGRYPSRDRGCAFRVSQKHFSELYSSTSKH